MNLQNPCSEVTLTPPQRLALQPNELRLYTFTLYQLRSLQQGVQAAHAAVELAMKCYREQMVLRAGTNWHMYHEWAVNWKTMVFLNGGDLTELRELYEFFCRHDRTLPFAEFYEDESLGGCMTSIATIIPERIFGTAHILRKNGTPETNYPQAFTEWELELIEILIKSGRAT